MKRQIFNHIATSHKVITRLHNPAVSPKLRKCSAFVLTEQYAADESFYCYHESQNEPNLRAVPCHEISGGFGPTIKHTGWFTDDYQNETIYGVVYRLPGDRGFLAGATFGENMATKIERHIIEDETEAVYAADSIAEQWAEQAREDAEKYDEEMDFA